MEYRLKLFRGNWAIVWREQKRSRRISLRTPDRSEAERRFEDWKLARKQPSESVADIMQEYLNDKDRTAVAPQRLRDAWKQLSPFFGSYRPDQINRTLCRQYVDHRRKQGRRNGTIQKELRTLRAGLRWHDSTTPAVIEVPPSDPPRDRYLTKEEVSNLLESTATPHIRLFILLAVATAARATALLELTWDRVDMEKALIHLSDGRQGLKGRATVPVNNSAMAALNQAATGSTTQYVIEYGDKPVKSVRHAFQRSCERAGLKDVSPHTLRHTAGVWMAEAGIPMTEIAQYMGHSDTRTTERVYARYSPEYLRKAANALEL